MAIIYPNVPEDYHQSLGEYQIFEALKNLPDDWTVFYSVNWHDRNDYGKIVWGEADFVVLHRRYGMLVIEVKSGEVYCRAGKWYQRRLDTGEEIPMKRSPFAQADRSKYTFLDLINSELSMDERCLVEKAVWFPSVADLAGVRLPMDYDEKIVLLASALSEPERFLVRAFNYYNATHYTRLSDAAVNKIRKIMMPEFNLLPAVTGMKDETDYLFYQLTNEQKKVLDFIGDQENAAVQGGAGTGKTFIAVELARRLAESGKQVLYLCFNRYLYQHLAEENKEKSVDYYNLHSFLAKHTGENVLTDEGLLEALEIIDWEDLGYDCLIVDEAQDFSSEVLSEILHGAKELRTFVFYDRNQLIYGKEMPIRLNEFDCKLTLTKNCRNTQKILQTTNSPMKLASRSSLLSIAGTMPLMLKASNLETLEKELIQEISRYLEKGYTLEEMVILTLKTESVSIFEKMPALQNRYNIKFTSVRKFKGLESTIVFLLDFDATIASSEEGIRLLYVGTSRAKQKLEILYLDPDNNDIAELARQIGDETHRPQIAISKFLKVRLKIL